MFNIFKAQLDSHLTEQESIIEIWNCSFDKKIDLALESHVTTSVLKIRKLAEAFKGKYLINSEKLFFLAKQKINFKFLYFKTKLKWFYDVFFLIKNYLKDIFKRSDVIF